MAETIKPIDIRRLNPLDFQLFDEEKVSAILSPFYSKDNQLVDKVYVNNSMAVGVLVVTEEHCRGHLDPEIQKGVDQIEAMGQTFVLYLMFNKKIPNDKMPRFELVENFGFKMPAVPGAKLNIAVVPLKEEEMKGYGEINCGRLSISKGVIQGSFVDKEKAVNDIKRVTILELKQIPIFP